jgi:hypothetical protein
MSAGATSPSTTGDASLARVARNIQRVACNDRGRVVGWTAAQRLKPHRHLPPGAERFGVIEQRVGECDA